MDLRFTLVENNQKGLKMIRIWLQPPRESGEWPEGIVFRKKSYIINLDHSELHALEVFLLEL